MINIIVGLGNPGDKYHKTRHNAGFDFIAELKKKWKLEFDEIKSIKSQLSSFVLDDTKVYIQIPNVFMNNSGNAIQPAVKRYNLNLNIKPGTSKIPPILGATIPVLFPQASTSEQLGV